MEEFSSCGLFDCGNCGYRRQGACPGCVQGNTFLESWDRSPCAIFTCTRSRGIADCRVCDHTVCDLRGSAETVCPLRAGLEDRSHWVWRIAQHLDEKGACHAHPPIPLKALMRLRWYLAALESFIAQGLDVISSRELADKVGVGAAMVRKDFSHFGDLGTPGLGYHAANLRDRIRGVLERYTCQLVWVGAEWLGNILASFPPTMDLNFRIVAAFETRPNWIGKSVGPWEVRPLAELSAFLSRNRVDGAVLAVPEHARTVADELVAAGVKGILNLTPVTIAPPADVNVRHVDLIGEMMALAMEVSEGGAEARTAWKRRSESEAPVEAA